VYVSVVHMLRTWQPIIHQISDLYRHPPGSEMHILVVSSPTEIGNYL